MARTALEIQDAELAASEKRNQDAHERAMARRRRFIESNPNAVSPSERKLVVDDYYKRQEGDILRKHELDILGKQGENALALQDKVNEGSIAVAQANGLTQKEIAGLNNASAEKIAAGNNASAEKIAAGNNASNEKIAGDTLLSQKEIAGLNNASAEKIEDIKGKAHVEGAKEQAKIVEAQWRSKENIAAASNDTKKQIAAIKASGLNQSETNMVFMLMGSGLTMEEAIAKVKEQKVANQ